MSTLAKFGLWQKAQEPLETGFGTDLKGDAAGLGCDETRANAGLNQETRFPGVFSPNRFHVHDTHTHNVTCGASHMETHNNLGNLGYLVQASKSAGPADDETRGEPGKTRFRPDGPVELGHDDPGDAGLEWHGEAEAGGEPTISPHSLHARLGNAGAVIDRSREDELPTVIVPPRIPLALVREVEARGWRIIPGGKPNPEAEHDDAWLAGTPIAEPRR